MATINDLSDAILCEIFLWINVIERQRLEIVCKQWRKVIRHIWSTKTKLIFHIQSDEDVDDIETEITADCVEFTTSHMSKVLAILKICEGNLTCVEINDEAPPPEEVETVIVPLRQNKYLSTFKIVSEDKKVVERFLHYLPTECLQQLSISFFNPGFELPSYLIERLNEILLEARSLESIHLIGFNVISTTLKAIENLSSLVHLEFGCVERSTEEDGLSFNINRLKNLESLSISDEKIVDDRFLMALMTNCQQLLAIKIHSESLTDESFEIMKTLPNMRCVLIG